jgi:LAO/AO transport system kinase
MSAMSAKRKPEMYWRPPVIMAQATCDRGTDEIAGAILKHRDYLAASGELDKRRRERARLELAWALEYYLNKYIDSMDQGQLAQMVDNLAQRKTNPRSVVTDIMARISEGGRDGLFADRNTKDA